MFSSVTALAIQSWTLYALGICLIFSRIAFRLTTLGSFARLQIDDWLMLFVLIPFTGSIVLANQTTLHNGASNRDFNNHIKGLKIRLALEELQIITKWLVKACLLILYLRIFPMKSNKRECLFLRWISIYLFLSFLVIQIMVPIWCNPMHGYWSLTPNNAQCTTYHNHSITTLFFSVTTTLAVLICPIPFIPTPRKFLCALLLLLGSLVLVAGVVARYYIITQPSSSIYLYWYATETSLAITFANLPFLTSLVVSTAPARIRHLSTNLSLSHWPRSCKDTPPRPAHRLNSIATTISVLSRTEADEIWSDSSVPPSRPPTPVYKRRLTDAPPELEDYWSKRRPSTRDMDVEKVEFKEPRWPLP